MRPVYLASTVRAAEEPLLRAHPGLLMQRAAAGLASVVLGELRERRVRGAYGARVLLAVGGGNNGGDALYAGVRLLARGVRTSAWRTAASVHDEAWRTFRAAGGREVDAFGALAELATADLVVDGVFGIGGRGGLPEPVALFARACGDAAVPVVAVDLPSGLDADRGTVPTQRSGGGGGGLDSSRGWVWPPKEPATEAGWLESNPPPPPTTQSSHFTADLTVSFGELKPCHVLEPAASACGRVELIDIGLDLPAPDLRAWDEVDLAAAWPFPDATSDKYARGVVGIDTGSDAYPGAAVLSTLGAVHAGAGMVRFAGAEGAVDLIRSAAPNVVFGEGRVQSRVLGCGWGDRPDGGEVVERALADGLPVVVDADALRFLPHRDLGELVLLTPHAGELARLLRIERSEVAGDPLVAVRSAASRFGATVLLKGATQYVCGPDGRVTLALPGPSWTAQAGSGDVLAGICGTLLAAGLAPANAALAAASVQALAATRNPGPYPSHQFTQSLPSTIAQLHHQSSVGS